MHQSTTHSNSPSLLSPVPRILALGACAMTLLLALRLCIRARNDFRFEDAYMFFRYAVQVRHGFGISWNPGGPHTFGLTSLPWLVVVWLGSFLSFIPQHLLPSLSTAIGLLALFLLSWLFSRRAHSPWLRHLSITFPLVAFPLLFNHLFDVSLTNGMETMLGLLFVTLFLFQVLRLVDQPSSRQSLFLALLAVLAVLTRPEAILPVALTPLCAIPLLPRARRLPLLSLFFTILGVLLAADLLINRAYFGTPVPLAFYIKAVHGYEGYLWLLNPFAANLSFFSMAAPALLAIVLFSRRHQLRVLLLFLLPLAGILLYLLSVLQIMGPGARYYVPFLPFLLLPALLVTDEALTRVQPSTTTPAPLAPVSFARLCSAIVILLCSNTQYAEHIFGPLGSLLARNHRVWDRPVLTIAADQPLQGPPDIWLVYESFASIAAKLPPGSRLALTEVGIVGAASPQADLLDMAGLNNAFLARHHFDMPYIFSQQPDLIWLPHFDYSRSYGIFCTDPQLLRDYTVYADAFIFGIAVRKQSPFHDQIVALLEPEFARLYPGATMSNHQVRSVAWNPNPTHNIDSNHIVEP